MRDATLAEYWALRSGPSASAGNLASVAAAAAPSSALAERRSDIPLDLFELRYSPGMIPPPGAASTKAMLRLHGRESRSRRLAALRREVEAARQAALVEETIFIARRNTPQALPQRTKEGAKPGAVDLLPTVAVASTWSSRSQRRGSCASKHGARPARSHPASSSKTKPPELSPERQASVDDVLHQLKTALAKNLRRITDTFREIDKDKSGKIDKREFHLAMTELDVVPHKFVMFDDELVKDDADDDDTIVVFDDTFDTLDSDRSGTLEYQELHTHLRRRVEDPTHAGAMAGAMAGTAGEGSMARAPRKYQGGGPLLLQGAQSQPSLSWGQLPRRPSTAPKMGSAQSKLANAAAGVLASYVANRVRPQTVGSGDLTSSATQMNPGVDETLTKRTNLGTGSQQPLPHFYPELATDRSLSSTTGVAASGVPFTGVPFTGVAASGGLFGRSTSTPTLYTPWTLRAFAPKYGSGVRAMLKAQQLHALTPAMRPSRAVEGERLIE